MTFTIAACIVYIAICIAMTAPRWTAAEAADRVVSQQLAL